jgi:uncharacterized repeat protein (TIGR03803 family)
MMFVLQRIGLAHLPRSTILLIMEEVKVSHRFNVLTFTVMLAFAALAQAQTFTTLYLAGNTHEVGHWLNLGDGATPLESMTFGTSRSLYSTGPSEKILYNFQGGSDGVQPESRLVADSAGNFYGTTAGAFCGDTGQCGTVFELKRPEAPGQPWAETVLYNFCPQIITCPDGYQPSGGLVFDSKGNLYGATLWGGPGGSGTIFELSPQPGGGWAFTTIYGFTGGDGALPNGDLVVDHMGNLFGTTANSGKRGDGTAFELSPPSGNGNNWSLVTIRSFDALRAGGAAPSAGLVMNAEGNLYGTTSYGGVGNCHGSGAEHGCGLIFKLIPPKKPGAPWGYQILYKFQGGTTDGQNPESLLLRDSAGNLYGTTPGGGPGNGCGIAFKLTESGGSWTESVLHYFQSAGDGCVPLGPLVLDRDGNAFGTTWQGGSSAGGTVFELSPTSDGWTETVVHSFLKNGVDGYAPFGGVIADFGALYGTTAVGGTGDCVLGEQTGCGTVFKVASR